MEKLINGVVDFRQKSRIKYCNKFSKLAVNQSPDTLLVSCCDSRVVPHIFTSADPGDLFVLRNIGNLIPSYSNKESFTDESSVAATLEFSLHCLNVSDIIVSIREIGFCLCDLYKFFKSFLLFPLF